MKYKHKPTVVEAIRLSHQNVTEVQRWCQAKTTKQQPTRTVTGLEFHTLEGVTIAGYGDWVIRGQAGELYPCKAHIFEANYDPVTVADFGIDKLRQAFMSEDIGHT